MEPSLEEDTGLKSPGLSSTVKSALKQATGRGAQSYHQIDDSRTRSTVPVVVADAESIEREPDADTEDGLALGERESDASSGFIVDSRAQRRKLCASRGRKVFFCIAVVLCVVTVGVLVWKQEEQNGGSGSGGGCAVPASKTVIMVAFDGFRWDYSGRTALPNFDRLCNGVVGADAGTRGCVRATAMRPSFPSKTFPNMYTLVTGLYPESHGIVDNSMYDPTTGQTFNMGTTTSYWWGGDPVWNTAERNGLRAGAYFWPGSEVEIGGQRPSFWKHYDGAVPNLARVDAVLDWLVLPALQRPSLALLYFSDVDDAGHNHGPDSNDVTAAVRTVDTVLGHLIDGLVQRALFNSTDIVLVADHGMTQLSNSRLIFLDDYIDLDMVRVVTYYPVTNLFVEEPQYLQYILGNLTGAHPHYWVWPRASVPERFHFSNNQRIGDVVGLADLGWTVTTRGRSITMQGQHGYDNQQPDMGALFMATGPSFLPNQHLDSLNNTSVYPLVCRLLRIPASPNNGTVGQDPKLWATLRNQTRVG